MSKASDKPNTAIDSCSPRFLLKNALRKSARDRYWDEFDIEEYECPSCGISGVPFEVHHRDRDAFNNHPLNLIGLCVQCHRRAHRLERIRNELSEWKERINGGDWQS